MGLSTHIYENHPAVRLIETRSAVIFPVETNQMLVLQLMDNHDADIVNGGFHYRGEEPRLQITPMDQCR